MPGYKKILIIKPSSLGDIVHALPAVAALRARYPQAHIAWLVKRQWAGIVERAEGVDQVWPVEGGIAGWLSQVSALRAAAFDLVVDLQGLFRSAAMARLTGCSTRVGFANGREGSPLLYTTRVLVPALDMHAVDRYLLVAEALGAPVRPVPPVRFRIRAEDEEAVNRLLSPHGLVPGGGWIAMNVSARWPTKRWPLERFAVVADGLQREGAGRVVLIGGPDERTDAASLKALMQTAPVDLTGQTSPGLLPALLESAALLVTNDSGPMHVAAAVGTPVVAVFGPTSPVRTGPYGAGHAVLTHAVPCSPCFSRTCRNAEPLACLKGIAPEAVVQVATRFLARDRRPSRVAIGRNTMDDHPDLTSSSSWQALIDRFRKTVEETYGENLDQIILYGSRARGDWEAESDVDLLVVLKELKDFWGEVRRLEAIAYHTTFGSGVPILLSVIPVKAEDFMTPVTPFLRNLRREGIPV